MSRPYTVRPPVRKPIDFQNAAAAAFVGVTSRSIRSTRIAFASSRRRVAKARPIPFRRIAGSTKKSFTTRSRPSSADGEYTRSEEHTSELQSQSNLVCRLLLEKKKNIDLTIFADSIDCDPARIALFLVSIRTVPQTRSYRIARQVCDTAGLSSVYVVASQTRSA